MVKRLLLAFPLLAHSLSLAFSTTSIPLIGNARRSLMTERSERMSEEASWHNCLCDLLPLHTVFVLCLAFLNVNRVLLYGLSYLCPKIFYFVGILSGFCRVFVGFLSEILNFVGFLSVFCRYDFAAHKQMQITGTTAIADKPGTHQFIYHRVLRVPLIP